MDPHGWGNTQYERQGDFALALDAGDDGPRGSGTHGSMAMRDGAAWS